MRQVLTALTCALTSAKVEYTPVANTVYFQVPQQQIWSSQVGPLCTIKSLEDCRINYGMTDAMTSKNGTFEETNNFDDTYIYIYTGTSGGDKNSIGVKSYHFSPRKSYINYEGTELRTDDGTLYPDKKYFENAKLDVKKRTFTGQIKWDESPAARTVLWDIDIQFSKDWKKIESGT